jgi:DNA-binding NtrC family response regulator
MTHLTTVLIVEDEALVRMHGVDLLQDAGFLVLEAADADEALTVLDERAEVQLLFSDIDMPGSMNGLELAAVAYERWPHIHLLVTSGHHRLDNADVPGTGRFIRKPWTADTLLEQINALADN